ncbi:MAG TPA: anaerobic sulfite reductase subunit AsrB [Rectinemataceae bacterium]|nr:anaerobic sulfite reductase subunit AsrB [Rectinemataceae bacterium]
MTANIFKPDPYRIADIVHETELEYTFKVEAGVKVDHGQFFQISLPEIGEAPISVSGIGRDWLEFTIRKVGKVTHRLFSLRRGDRLFMRGPYGNSFPLDEFRGKDLVVIAGGTGVSPVRSLLKHYFDHFDEIRSLHFIAGFKDRDSILFADDLKDFAAKFDAIYTLDKEAIPGFQSGLVTEHIKKIPFAGFADYNVVIVGPPAMMRYAALECLKNGVSKEKIWMSFERKMSCAVGKCGHCKIDETYVCLEGPVFNYTKAEQLLD